MENELATPFESRPYKRSRKAYAIECAFEYFVSLLVTDSFLAKLLTNLGFTDAQTGLISSLISLAFLFQLLAVPVVQRITNVKRFGILFHCGSQLLFMSLFLIPFLPAAAGVRKALSVVCLLLAYLGNYLVTSVIYRWGNSFVNPHKRALYGANKEMISLLSGIVVSLAMGYLIDQYEANGQLLGGFLFLACGILVFSAGDFCCLMMIQNDTQSREQATPVMQVVRHLLQNRNFQSVVLLGVLWNVGVYLTLGFLGTYKINELLFTVGQVQLFNIVGCLGRAVLSRPFGKYSDRHSFASGVELALVIAIAAFAVNIFTATATRWLIVGFTLLYNVCMAGIYANMINMMYSYVEREYFVQANALKNSIGGLSGFLASIGGSWILTRIQENGNQLWGIPVYGQQVLSLLSVIVLTLALLLTRFVIRKQKVVIQ